MQEKLSIAFIGGGNMAAALVAGLVDKRCAAGDIHIIDISEATCAAWRARGMSAATTPDARLADCRVWVYAVKPQHLRDVAIVSRVWLRDDTLVISIAAGIRADTLAAWLGQAQHPYPRNDVDAKTDARTYPRNVDAQTDARTYPRVVRAMPNTPALVGAGITGLAALAGVDEADRALAADILAVVGDVVWVENDAQIDAVTAVSGSGPAYVFRFLEGLIQGGQSVGLSAEQSRQLALATLAGGTIRRPPRRITRTGHLQRRHHGSSAGGI